MEILATGPVSVMSVSYMSACATVLSICHRVRSAQICSCCPNLNTETNVYIPDQCVSTGFSVVDSMYYSNCISEGLALFAMWCICRRISCHRSWCTSLWSSLRCFSNLILVVCICCMFSLL